MKAKCRPQQTVRLSDGLASSARRESRTLGMHLAALKFCAQDAPLGEALTNLTVSEQPKRAKLDGCHWPLCILGLNAPDRASVCSKAHLAVKVCLSFNGRAAVFAEDG